MSWFSRRCSGFCMGTIPTVKDAEWLADLLRHGLLRARPAFERMDGAVRADSRSSWDHVVIVQVSAGSHERGLATATTISVWILPSVTTAHISWV